jgi:diacylglycerol kinase (ATP)
MRILLVHNPKAGSGKHQGEDLIKALKRAGHKAIYQSSKKKGITKALKKTINLVLVAGGDGTVSKIACRLVSMKSKIPLSVLPLGTANNFARSLGFCLSQDELIEQLGAGECESFDVGLARGPWGERYFFEGAGAGLFADYLQAPKENARKEKTGSKAEKMRHHIWELHRRLKNYRAREWGMALDGEDVSGPYLVWHAMNLRSVGPVLTLAPDAKTNDGAFDFVGAQEKDRSVLLEYFEARAAGKRRKLPLSVKCFRRMRLRWNKSPLHFDDEVWSVKKEKRSRSRDIEILVKDSALRIWRVR